MSQQNYYSYNTGYAGGAAPSYTATYNYGVVGQQTAAPQAAAAPVAAAPQATHAYAYGTSGAVARTAAPAQQQASYYPAQQTNTASGYYAAPASAAAAKPAAQKTYASNQPIATYSYSSSTNAAVANSAPAGGSATGASSNSGYGRSNSGMAGGNQQRSSSSNQGSGKSSGSGYTGYDAAVYAAATSYLQSKQTNQTSNWLGMKRGSGGTGGSSSYRGNSSYRGGFPRKSNYGRGGMYNRDPTQMHYCEVCKVSCGTSETLKAHLEGKNHKKKEAILKTGAAPQPLARNKSSYKCDLCGIICTGQDTYSAHVRGTRHQKTVKLHQQLGKPVPDSSNPTVIPPVNPIPSKVVGVPKMNFVGGKVLNTTTGEEVGVSKGGEAAAAMAEEKSPEPVGEDYVEMVKDEAGRCSYRCKLCDCGFTDLNAKEMHMKGRRHRVQYKIKVDPSLAVEIKPPPKGRRMSPQDSQIRRQLSRLRQQEMYSMRAQYEMEMKLLMSSRSTNLGSLFPTWTKNNQRESLDDRHVMAKHAEIYPTEEELTGVQKIVTNAEKALKNISDAFALADTQTEPAKTETVKTETVKTDTVKTDEKPAEPEPEKPKPERLLKGVMRVGALAKGLLLRGDLHIQVVVLCSEKPTKTLLNKVVGYFPKEFETLGCKDDYVVTVKPHESSIYLTTKTEPKIVLAITMTSVAIRDPEAGADGAATKPDPPDILNKNKCLEALAALRHAKWFQARCANLPSCLVVLRVLRDLCKRVPTWTHLTPWASELLCEKVMSSAGGPVSPGDGFRRIFEAVASGVLLLSGPGLMDPCEKDPLDAVANMTPQQREDITSSAQHALRLVAFNQLYKVLAMEKIVDRKAERKRPRDSTDTSMETNGKQVKTEAA